MLLHHHVHFETSSGSSENNDELDGKMVKIFREIEEREREKN